jgi:hypothetical protein
MSVKNNAFIAFALAAAGVTLTAGAKPVPEGLLNDYTVSKIDIAQIDDNGRCIVLVGVTAPGGTLQSRVVCSTSGDVKLFADFGAVEGLVKRAKLASGSLVSYYKKDKASSVGDPIAGLKSQYKAFKVESASSLKAGQTITAKLVAAQALGWNTQTGTPEALEYADLQDKGASVGEWNTFCAARVTTLAAALTAAGVDPVTVV